MKKFYTVYKITNIRNGKFYFGQHVTTNILDGYMGSGTELLKDQEKYGIHNFKKEIIDVFDNFNDMDDLERKLISENSSIDSYNLMPGGSGIKPVNLDDATKERFDWMHTLFSSDIELGKFVSYSEKHLYEIYIKKAAKSRTYPVEYVNFRKKKKEEKRKTGFGNLCKEYKELSDRLKDPFIGDEYNEVKSRMEEILEMSDFLRDSLEVMSIELMKSRSYNQQKIKEIIRMHELKDVVDKYGFVPNTVIPYDEVPKIIQRMYDDHNIKRNPRRTILDDWFDVTHRVMIDGKTFTKINEAKNK